MKFAAPRKLERAALLHVFALEERGDAGFAVEAVRIHDRRSSRDGPDAFGGGSNVVQGYGGF